MALKLSLKPHEKVVINGAVIANGDRRSTICVENIANVLREGDIIQPEQVNTPAKRIYLPIMLMIMGEGCTKELFSEFEARLQEFVGVVTDVEALQVCTSLAAKVANNEFYKALSMCRLLIEFERKKLSHVA